MAVQINTHGDHYRLREDYTMKSVEEAFEYAEEQKRATVAFRDRSDNLVIFSVGGTAPIALAEYNPEVFTLNE